MKRYEDMSDHEINMAVTCICNGCQGWSWLGDNSGFYHCGVDGSGFYEVKCVDYCSSPSDAWSIMLEHGVSVILTETCTDDGDFFEAFYMNGHLGYGNNQIHAKTLFSTFDKNPLRAAMICFLKMKDAE